MESRCPGQRRRSGAPGGFLAGADDPSGGARVAAGLAAALVGVSAPRDEAALDAAHGGGAKAATAYSFISSRS